jgi:D-3-phosphoglycerate dehydrogenase / 2-oxoglutarate reductase
MARGLGMTVVASDPYASQTVAASENVTLVKSLAELLPQCDFLTIHTPMLASTRGMMSTEEMSQIKKGARILNVARGGIIDEAALLAGLESGHLGGAALDVFTSEPPANDPDSTLTKLLAHPKCIATPHLGASTVEAQENVSIDVGEQVLQILAGELPRSAVNAPIILPAEYKTLQPFVKLVEKMGSLYTQHFSQASAKRTAGQQQHQRNTFDLIYEGELAGMSSTKPLFAALIKGLTSPIAEAGGLNINIVNAEMVAKERGIFVNEQKSRDPNTSQQAYSSLVTLVARPPSRAPSMTRHASYILDPKDDASKHEAQHIISGYCSSDTPIILRLDRFSTSFVPDGTLLICHNYDSPGKIGVVGSLLGKEEVNINFMSVAPASYKAGASMTAVDLVKDRLSSLKASEGVTSGGTSSIATPQTPREAREALMILGVDGEVSDTVIKELIAQNGVLSVSSVTL